MLLVACAGWACGSRGTRVNPLATSVQPPSNVAIYLSVEQSGEPVTDLTRESFRLFENGQPLDSNRVSLVLLPREVAARHHVLILVDATLATTASDRGMLATAIKKLAETLSKDQPVSIASFDGTDKLTSIAEVDGNSAEDGGSRMDALDKISPVDPSRNLNGAVIAGLAQLDASLAHADKPVRVGSLVVITGGPDMAGVSRFEQVDGELASTRDHVLAIGVGPETGKISLERIGRDGTFRAESLATVTEALDKAAARLAAIEKSHYLLAYCSPARSGVRDLKIAVRLIGHQWAAHQHVDASEVFFRRICSRL